MDSLSVEGQSLCLMTQKGIFKKSSLSLFSRPRKGGVIALKIDDDDHLISATVSQPGAGYFYCDPKGLLHFVFRKKVCAPLAGWVVGLRASV